MKKYITWKIIIIILVALGLGFFDLPSETQKTIFPATPESITNTRIHLGLDLQGGSQLDYKIDLRKVPEADQENIIDGVLEVIEKRVNGLGVAEPNIYTADIAGEKHIIVEIAETTNLTQEDVDMYLGKDKGVETLTDDEKKLISLEKAKATVGKTIQLEFKEEKTTMDPQEIDKIREKALTALDRIIAGEDYSVVGQEEQQAYPGKVKYEISDYVFEQKIPDEFLEIITTLEVGEYHNELVDTNKGSKSDDKTGEQIQDTGLAILKLVDITEEVKNEKEVYVSHILISYKGLETAGAGIILTKDEAYDLAKEINEKIEDGASFADLAKEYSNDTLSSEDGGVLSDPVTSGSSYQYDFEQAALAFEEEGEISDVINDKFGYHIIKAEDIRTNVTEKQYRYETITYSTIPDPWEETGLTGEHFIHADVMMDDFYQPYVAIKFNDEGARLFEEITERNVDKPLAIFVGGEFIDDPTVNQVIHDGNAIIQGNFTPERAKELARDLNTGAIPAPIVLTGEYTIGATLGQEALSKSLWAGGIGLLLILIFMLLYYRMAGLVADGALLVYASILLFLIKSQLHIGVALLIALIIFGFIVLKITQNKDSGWEKLFSFILSCVAFFFITYLLKTGIVLTLAGVAGIVLSIGIAVDANILIFERFKEELLKGKTFSAAIETGFDRAWSSIRDSNFSTLLTCAILFTFGSSIIKGFAFNLAAGILVSMFTAITITKIFLKGFIGKKIAENIRAFGVNPEKKNFNFKFIKNSKIWFGFSGILVGISLIAIVVFGINLGIDFTGGTLMEFKFEQSITKDTLTTTLNEIEKEINEENGFSEGNGNTAEAATLEEEEEETAEPVLTAEESVEDTPTETSVDTQILKTDTDSTIISNEDITEIDLSTAQVIESGENVFIVKTKYISSAVHGQLIAKMRERLPEFTEPRFTTIGPTIGKTMLSNAIKAVAFALIVIIVYVAFAFRKIPKEVSPWRFGACAIVALLHDVIIVTGFFIILGQFMNVEIDALFITAILTVFGYSVNDTIVVFDRLRENLILSKENTVSENADKALNQTLTRSINTSLSTLFTLVAILILGSESIFFFVLALTAGTVIGTYSSIFTASPLLVAWNKAAAKKKARLES